VAHDDSDLILLFSDEARERLDRIASLVGGGAEDRDAAVEVQRELHAIKGASRMLGLSHLSELCHRAEELVEHRSEDFGIELTALLDRLFKAVDSLHSLPESTEKLPKSDAARVDASDTRSRRDTLRVRTEAVDGMADRSARLRVLSTAAARLVDRTFRLAYLAERGSRERSPREVLATVAASLRQLAVELEAGQRRIHRLAEGLLDAMLRLQLQPLRPVLLSLARHARELALSLEREVDVVVESRDTYLDRRIIHALEELLLHVVRNAVDHGIESAQERVSAGKPERGSIRLEAAVEGDRVRIAVADDGRGIDPEHILSTAIMRGEIERGAASKLSTDEILQLLLRPGFSTREEASETSGRGIGLDAVATKVLAIGGDLGIESDPGAGTTVSVHVPTTRRGERVLVIQVGDSVVAFPAANVRAYRVLDRSALETIDDRTILETQGGSLRARFLNELLGKSPSPSGTVIEVVIGGVASALIADAVVGEEEVFLRPLPARAGAPRLFDSVALLSSGRPVAVLSTSRLGLMESRRDATVSVHTARGPLRVLLVDDSMATREMIRRLLEDSGFVVLAVGSAEEALDRLGEVAVDCVITDIEMPGMDGLELTRSLRRMPGYDELPVIVISTLDRAGDRRAGLEAGADAYLYKKNLDTRELLALVRRVGGGG
jgi:chemotaxis protein histidine kinase CheA/ActR/RegA family two-component response regulator